MDLIKEKINYVGFIFIGLINVEWTTKRLLNIMLEWETLKLKLFFLELKMTLWIFNLCQIRI